MGTLALPGPFQYSVKYKGNSANHARNPAARSEKAQMTIAPQAAVPPASHSVFSVTDDVRGVTINLELLAAGDTPAPGNTAVAIPAPWNVAGANGLANNIANALLAANFKATRGNINPNDPTSLLGVTTMNARVSGNDSAGTVQLGGGPGVMPGRSYNAPLVVGLFNLGGFVGMTLANDGSADRYDAVAGGLVRRKTYFW